MPTLAEIGARQPQQWPENWGSLSNVGALVPPPANPAAPPAAALNALHSTFVQPFTDAYKAVSGQMTPQEQQDFAFNAALGLLPMGRAGRAVHAAEEALAPAAKTFSRDAATTYRFPDGSHMDPSFQQFFEGNKPLLLATAGELQNFRGLPPDAVSRARSVMDPTGKEHFVFWQPGKEDDAKRLMEIYRNKPATLQPEQHREIGQLLGYPADEIEAFIRK